MRTSTAFNADWLFAPHQLPLDAPDDAFQPVTLPHTNITLPHHNFDNIDYQFVSTYRKRFHLPEPRSGRRVFLDFNGAMLISTVYLNGVRLAVHAGGYTPFSIDISDHVKDAGENILTVHLDSHENPEVPPFGYVVDYLTFGGIYREVHLRMVEALYIKDVFVRPREVLSGEPQLDFDITVTNATTATVPVRWSIGFGARYGKTHIYKQDEVSVLPHSTITITDTVAGTSLPLWSLHSPLLSGYISTLRRLDVDDAPQDYVRGSFGIRQAEFRDDGGFYLNGERVQLFGLNRHQTYPYIGAAAPKRLQVMDADILKHELGCNIVRTSHYPQSTHFLNRCDEIGLLVFEEIPGWQHIGDDDWQALALRDVQAMIERDRNHASIIVWGVRINESADNDALYAKTNALAHALDPTRPTTGVRFFQDSSFLEDVFGFNDFSNGVEEPQHTPHLITEFNGHMFPTKTFDNEDRKIEHARRHAHIQNLAYGNPRVSGAIGWCAFDYNTHKEFGSGDRICYHGVMDIFRLPKWAAAVYASQQSPDQRVVLHAVTHWTMGDRSAGGNDPLMVLSNVDEIDVWFGEQHLGRFQPDRATYPHLPHPPFTVTGLGMLMMWGQSFGTLRIAGYINGQQVAEQLISSDGVPHKLLLAAYNTELHADNSDMTRISARITDAFGNTLPYALQPVTFELEGDGAIIGENPLVLPGGQGAVFLKAGKTPGRLKITAHTPRLAPASVSVRAR